MVLVTLGSQIPSSNQSLFMRRNFPNLTVRQEWNLLFASTYPSSTSLPQKPLDVFNPLCSDVEGTRSNIGGFNFKHALAARFFALFTMHSLFVSPLWVGRIAHWICVFNKRCSTSVLQWNCNKFCYSVSIFCQQNMLKLWLVVGSSNNTKTFFFSTFDNQNEICYNVP